MAILFNILGPKYYSACLSLTPGFEKLHLKKKFSKYGLFSSADPRKLIYHSSVIASLEDANIDPDVMRYLCRLYRQQVSYVSVDGAKSRLLRILRGVRQGDPMSPVLFNNVSRIIFRKLKAKWAAERRGTDICGSDTTTSTHTMFADDTTILASSEQDLLAMLKDVEEALAEHGLKLNIDKCNVQTTTEHVQHDALDLDGQRIEIVSPMLGFKVLGTQFTLLGKSTTELKSRVGAA